MVRGSRRQSTRIDLRSVSDASLIQLSRDGSADAFGELWARHHCVIERRLTAVTNYEVEDVVQEASIKVHQHLLKGGDIPISFRAYLLATARNIAIDMSRKAGNAPTASFEEEVHNLDLGNPDHAEVFFEKSTTTRALKALKPTQRELLWYRDVEDLPLKEVARFVGMTENTATVALKRAREAFKSAWIDAQLSPDRTLGDDCAAVVPLLGKYARDTLKPRAKAQVELHLMDCTHCLALQVDANHLHKKLALVILPMLLLTGAAGFREFIASGGNIPDYGAAAAVQDPGAASSASSSPSSGAVIATTAGVGGAKLAAIAAATASVLVVGTGIFAATSTAPRTAPTKPAVEATAQRPEALGGDDPKDGQQQSEETAAEQVGEQSPGAVDVVAPVPVPSPPVSSPDFIGPDTPAGPTAPIDTSGPSDGNTDGGGTDTGGGDGTGDGETPSSPYELTYTLSPEGSALQLQGVARAIVHAKITPAGSPEDAGPGTLVGLDREGRGQLSLEGFAGLTVDIRLLHMFLDSELVPRTNTLFIEQFTVPEAHTPTG